MGDVHYLAVVVAAIAAFVMSWVWYTLFGKALAKVSTAFAEQEKPEGWRLLVEVVRSLVLALVLAYVIGRMGQVDLLDAAGIGVVLWIGLPAVQWVGSIVWEKQPLRVAAIHAGDWLVKLVLIAVIVGVWRQA